MGRSGFVTLVGRPNVGKSTLVNRLVGAKVSIVSDKVQTTRTQIRGILQRGEDQVIFVDTPGMHRPRGPLGPRLAEVASQAMAGVDVVCIVLDATCSLGPGDRAVAAQAPPGSIVVLNKIDRASPNQVLLGLAGAAELDASDYYPVSAQTGEGVDALLDGLLNRLSEGPAYYPSDTVSDVDEADWVAELVREQLLAVLRDELPHAVTTRVTEWEWPRIRCEILVQRSSQKGIVIGHQGSVLKEVGTSVRRQLAPGAFVELMVKVDKDWPHRV